MRTHASIPEEPAGGAGLHPSEVGQDARIEALTDFKQQLERQELRDSDAKTHAKEKRRA